MTVQSEKLRKSFLPFTLPEELERLMEFENGISRDEGYARGFEFGGAEKDDLKGYSEAPEFLEGFLPIGQATNTGSQYFLWTVGQQDTAKMPVVVFGDEGGKHVIAENVRELLVLLAFDAEPLVDHDGAAYVRQARDAHSEMYGAYVAWLKRTYGLAPLQDVDPVLERARARHEAAFNDWFARFFSDT